MSKEQEERGLNILCFDGDGVNGLSSLDVLGHVLARLGVLEPYGLPLSPNEYFDIIAGTGTGGLSACLLGRMDCIPIMARMAYGLFLWRLFHSTKTFGANDLSAYSGTRLKEAIKQMIADSRNSEEMRLEEGKAGNKCKTMLFAASKRGATGGSPTIFRSYKPAVGSNPDITVWEALYHTLAHPVFFPSLELSEQPMKQSLVKDDSWGGNSIAHVIAEARSLYPGRRISCILSIGAGHARTIQLPDPDPTTPSWFLRMNAVTVMKKMAADNETAAEAFAAQIPAQSGVYYRFNVDEGTQVAEHGEWEESHQVEERTKIYMETDESEHKLEHLVGAIKGRKPIVAVTSIGPTQNIVLTQNLSPTHSMFPTPNIPPAQVMSPTYDTSPAYNVGPAYGAAPTSNVPPAQVMSPTYDTGPTYNVGPAYGAAPTLGSYAQPAPGPPGVPKLCPTPTSFFTGREVDIKYIEGCLTGFGERRVCVVYGLGGTGKTQLVLKAIERSRNQWTEVVYVDASSSDAIESALQEVAIARNLGETYQDAIHWLGSRIESWLVVFDGVDRASTNVQNYFPGGNHGNIVITTRSPDLTLHARGPNSVRHISGMTHDDALALFLKTVHSYGREFHGEMEAIHMLLEEFGGAALAIAHAAAYIGNSSHISLWKYRELFLLQRQALMEQFQRRQVIVDDYNKAIFTTGKMCYDLLVANGDSQRTFWLLAYLHHGAIPEKIFQQASINMKSYNAQLPPTQVEATARDYMRDYLARFLDGGYWGAARFSRALGELVSCSLVEFDTTNNAYAMHPLIQDWARIVISQPPDLALECTTTLLSQSILASNAIDSQMFRRALVLHVNKIILEQRGAMGANHAASFAEVYGSMGRWNQKEALDIQVKQASEQALGPDHPYTLASINILASTYLYQGRWNEAEALQVPATNAQKRILGDEHPTTLNGMANLASAYSHQGRHAEAEQLRTKILNAFKRLFGGDHPATLNMMKNLATNFAKTARLGEAKVLLNQAMGSWGRKIGIPQPDAVQPANSAPPGYPPRPGASPPPGVNASTRPGSGFVQSIQSRAASFGSYVPYS